MAERSPIVVLPAGYTLRQGSTLDRALLVKFMHRTYLDIAGQADDVSRLPPHPPEALSRTVDHYLSADTPIWWVECDRDSSPAGLPSRSASLRPVAGVWVGSAIDQASGDRQAYIFLLYVAPEHRRRGIGTALMRQVEIWAAARGDRQIGLQVFHANQPALQLYQQLGYHVHALSLVKRLPPDRGEFSL